MKPTLFIAFSHTLTPAQIKGFRTQYGLDASFVSLSERNPDLHAKMSQIPADANLDYIHDLALTIVYEAKKASATHFFCVGEPTLTMWANLFASDFEAYVYHIGKEGDCTYSEWFAHEKDFKPLICIQSCSPRISKEVTNPDGTVTKTAVFEHVAWREMF